MKIVLFLCFFGCYSSLASAKSLTVTTPFNHYSLEYSEDKIELKSSHYRYSLSKMHCNQLMLQKFVKRVNQIVHSSALDSFRGDKPITLTLEKKNYYTTKMSKLGIGLLGLPKEVRRLTIQEQLMCKKK